MNEVEQTLKRLNLFVQKCLLIILQNADSPPTQSFQLLLREIFFKKKKIKMPMFAFLNKEKVQFLIGQLKSLTQGVGDESVLSNQHKDKQEPKIWPTRSVSEHIMDNCISSPDFKTLQKKSKKLQREQSFIKSKQEKDIRILQEISRIKKDALILQNNMHFWRGRLQTFEKSVDYYRLLTSRDQLIKRRISKKGRIGISKWISSVDSAINLA